LERAFDYGGLSAAAAWPADVQALRSRREGAINAACRRCEGGVKCAQRGMQALRSRREVRSIRLLVTPALLMDDPPRGEEARETQIAAHGPAARQPVAGAHDPS
jgi:hypothetical protein